MSTSLKQIEANRANALKSTGPRTEAGKLRSSQNARKHPAGISIRTMRIATENPEELNSFLGGYLLRFQPEDQPEYDCVSAMASAAWRLRRVWSLECAILDGQIAADHQTLTQEFESFDNEFLAGHAFRTLSDKSPATLPNLDRYESRQRRLWTAAHRNLLALRAEKKTKTKENPPDEAN
jgi:hypothetical protein